MKFKEALSVLHINSAIIDTDFELKAKKAYRSLALKYHPDLVGNSYSDKMSELVCAYDVVKDFIKNWKKAEVSKSCIVISMQDLINIYKGKELNALDNVITRSNIHNYNVVIECYVDVEYKGIKERVHKYTGYSKNDCFTIPVDITAKSMEETINVEVRCEDIERTIKFNCMSLKYVMTLDWNIKLALLLNRKLYNERK